MNFEKTVKLLKEKLNCEVIILFGSYARGDQRPDSDVDIAIKTKKEISKKDQTIHILHSSLINCYIGEGAKQCRLQGDIAGRGAK